MIVSEEIVRIGIFRKPHGIHGELPLMVDNEAYFSLEVPLTFIVCDRDGIWVPFFIESVRYKSDTVHLIKLQDVDTEEQAAAFTNEVVYAHTRQMGDYEQEASWSDFIGFQVIDHFQGELGAVISVDDQTENVLFEIETPAGDTLLIPVAEDLVLEVKPDQNQIIMVLPEGILDL